MGATSEIWMRFPGEQQAHRAEAVARDLLKVAYAPPDLPWTEAASECPSLSARYLAFREDAAGYELYPRYTALEWLRRDRRDLFIDRCQDIARWDSVDDPEALFPQLCFACALRYPRVPFKARYRHEVTVSGAILILRAEYDGSVLRFRKKEGMLPMDEDDWSRALIDEYAAENGVFVKKRTMDPMQNVKDRRAAVIARSEDEIRRRCRPLLLCLSGSIAYGLDTPDSDVDIRGIFLNEPEEWIGLREEQETIRLEDSDTVLYGLRKAMKLLMACNPNVVEMLGLRRQDILYCSPEGARILEAAPAFLSKKAIFTFGAYATNLRRQIQKRIDAGHVDKKALAKEMMHLLRIYDMGGALLQEGRVTTYRSETHSLLMWVRAGDYQDRNGMPTPEYERTLESFMGAFRAAATRTRLPPEPDLERINALTMEIARGAL